MTVQPDDPRLPAVLDAIESHLFHAGDDTMGCQCVCGHIVRGSRALAEHMARNILINIDEAVDRARTDETIRQALMEDALVNGYVPGDTDA